MTHIIIFDLRNNFCFSFLTILYKF